MTISIIAGLLSFSSYNIGFALEKEAINSLEQKKREKFFPMIIELITKLKWLFGLFLTIISIVFYYIALLWAPITAIAPLTGFGLLVLAIYAHYKVKERFSKKDILSFILVIIGISFSAFISAKHTTVLLYNQWQSFTFSTKSMILLGLFAFLELIFYVIAKFYSFKDDRKITLYYSLFAGLAAGIQTLVIKALTVLINTKNNVPLYFLQVTIIIVLFLITSIISTFALQAAFNSGKVSTSMSIYNGLAMIIPIIYSVISYDEWNSINLLLKAVLILAILMVLIAIIFLSSLPNNES